MKEKPANLNRGGMFFSEVEGHMQKLSSFGRGKKISVKRHLRGYSMQPFNFEMSKEHLSDMGESGLSAKHLCLTSCTRCQ